MVLGHLIHVLDLTGGRLTGFEDLTHEHVFAPHGYDEWFIFSESAQSLDLGDQPSDEICVPVGTFDVYSATMILFLVRQLFVSFGIQTHETRLLGREREGWDREVGKWIVGVTFFAVDRPNFHHHGA